MRRGSTLPHIITDLDMPSLLDRLKHLPDPDDCSFTPTSQWTRRGTHYMSGLPRQVRWSLSVLRVRRFSVHPTSIWVMGRWEAISQGSPRRGKIVGTIAVGFLGERGEGRKISRSCRGANAYMFDRRALKRWKFKESDLPPGSDVLFRPPSLWQRTKWLWVETLVITLSIEYSCLICPAGTG